jgi:hypothetical protein
MQEHFFLNLFFVGILKVSDENRRIGICIRIRIHQLEAWIRGSGSTPKCHGSAKSKRLISEDDDDDGDGIPDDEEDDDDNDEL